MAGTRSPIDAAIPQVGDRFRAVVVDEVQDFAVGWLESLQLLLSDPSDVFYVFHDPGRGNLSPRRRGLPRAPPPRAPRG